MKLNVKSISLFILIELSLWFGVGYLIFKGCDSFNIPMWLYKISFICLILSPIGKLILHIFRIYWRQDLESIDNKVEQPKMKIYGSSK